SNNLAVTAAMSMKEASFGCHCSREGVEDQANIFADPTAVFDCNHDVVDDCLKFDSVAGAKERAPEIRIIVGLERAAGMLRRSLVETMP
ncbi:hypothetical protein HK097_001618, partial [Rhizophlyctis rosea]